MKLTPALPDRLARLGGFDATACLNCGSCTALCPVGLATLPRRVFRLAMLGAREELVQHADTIFSCLLCGMCQENCPAGVPITENIRTLRTYLDIEEFRLATAGR